MIGNIVYAYPHYRVLYGDPKHSYQLLSEYSFELEKEIRDSKGRNEFVIVEGGWVRIRDGYAWDGPTGPVIHTTSWVRASLVHDVFYQMMRAGWVPYSYRKRADDLMFYLAKADKMPWWRAWYSWLAVRLFSGKYARPGGVDDGT
jgi:hypothetical protein